MNDNSNSNIPARPPDFLIPLGKREGESKEQMAKRLAGETMEQIRIHQMKLVYESAIKKAVQNLRATGHTEEEIEEALDIY